MGEVLFFSLPSAWPFAPLCKRVAHRVANVIRGGSRGRVQGVLTPLPPPWDDLRFSNTTGIPPPSPPQKKWFIGVEAEQETSAPPPKKNPGSAPGNVVKGNSPSIFVYERILNNNKIFETILSLLDLTSIIFETTKHCQLLNAHNTLRSPAPTPPKFA